METRTPLRVARNAMVASANPIASLIGTEILRAGGNAADATVAVGAALAVMEPQSSHIGGDAFAQIWDAPAGKLSALNGSGVAPALATVEAIGSVIPERGIRAAAVPGAVDAWLTLLGRWGTMTAMEVLAPAIRLAEDGYAIPARQIETLRAHGMLWEAFPQSGAALVPDTLRSGATLYQPALAETLRQIGSGGRAAFYEGAFAEKLLAYSAEQGGFFTAADLAAHRTLITDPIQTVYRGVTVTEQPPVSQGCLLLQMLNILEGYDLAALDPEGPDAVHLMAEAKKLAFADRLAYLGDVPETPLAALLSKEYAADQRKRINPAAASQYVPGRLPAIDGGSDTTSFCVVDSHGSAITWIQSVFHRYGSGVVVPGTGVLLNNRMTGFSLDPKSPNVLAPGKKTIHTLNTWMLFRGGEFWTAGGTPGADVQVQTNLQTVTQMIDHGRSPQEAIESPKWHDLPGGGPQLAVEDRLPLDTCYALRRRGHALAVGGAWSGACASQIIARDPETGVLLGGSDPRTDGLALGY